MRQLTDWFTKGLASPESAFKVEPSTIKPTLKDEGTKIHAVKWRTSNPQKRTPLPKFEKICWSWTHGKQKSVWIVVSEDSTVVPDLSLLVRHSFDSVYFRFMWEHVIESQPLDWIWEHFLIFYEIWHLLLWSNPWVRGVRMTSFAPPSQFPLWYWTRG